MENGNLSTLQILLVIIIPSFITSIPLFISALAAWKSSRKKKAEALTDEGTAAEKVSNAWEKFADDLHEQIEKMEKKNDQQMKKMDAKINRQGKRIRYLEHGVQILIEQVRTLGATPAFILEDDNSEKENENVDE